MRISDWSSDVCSSDLRDLKFADLGEGIVGPRIVIERLRAGGTREIIGTEPVGAEHDRIGGDRAEMLDEAREVERDRSGEHTSELQSLMRISYAVFCLKNKIYKHNTRTN